MKNVFFILITFVLMSSQTSFGSSLKPFTSDGCSSFPNGTISQKKLWLECCTLHDFAYWMGGSYSERRKADFDLRQCVAKVGEPEVANLMLAGVRVGGTPFLPTSFRWGYGWPYPRFYGRLSAEEKKKVKEILKKSGNIELLTILDARKTVPPEEEQEQP